MGGKVDKVGWRGREGVVGEVGKGKWRGGGWVTVENGRWRGERVGSEVEKGGS